MLAKGADVDAIAAEYGPLQSVAAANGRERVLDDIFCKTEDGSVFADKSLGVVLNTLLILLLEKSILITLSFCRTEID